MLCLIGAGLSVPTSALAQQFTFSTVALSGQPAPGTPEAFKYTALDLPSLNAMGQVVFRATITGNSTGLWLGAPGSVQLLAREGDPAPGTSAGVNYSVFGLGAQPINAAGQCAFNAEVKGAGVTFANNQGIWSGAPGSVVLLARTGDPAPGTAAGVNYADVLQTTTTINATGQSAFLAGVTGPGVTGINGRGVWVGAPGDVTLLARGGDPAPGTAAGVSYLFPNSPALNTSGQSVFSATLTGQGITSENMHGIWIGAPGSVTLLARAGDPAPGTPAGVNYRDLGDSSIVLSRPAINASKKTAFAASLAGPAITEENSYGLWSNTPGNVMLLARGGDPAPGTAAGVSYFQLFTPAINAAGQSAFKGSVRGPGITGANDGGLWLGIPGSVAKVVIEGEAAPGAGAGTLFGDPAQTGDFALNDRGEVVFLNTLTGPNVTFQNQDSLWFADAAGKLSLIVRAGNPFEVAPGDTRTISFLNFVGNFFGGSGDEDGLPCGFNDRGQLAFNATFSDGSSGIFIATPLPPAQLLNISTRMRVQTGENVLIGGFIITGTDSKNVIIRGIGPSLAQFFGGVLANPTLELFQGSTLLQSNNDWKDTQRIEIEATGLQPGNDFETAIMRTLPPGSYTAIVRGSNNTTGIGVVEAYDLNQAANSKLANIATRGFVEAGDNVMIGGLIIGPVGGSTARVVVRAIGPSLTAFGIAGALQDPTVDLKDANGATLTSNNDWQQGQPVELQQLGLAPTDTRESALVTTLTPGAYTAIVRGVGNTTGVGLVEFYYVQ